MAKQSVIQHTLFVTVCIVFCNCLTAQSALLTSVNYGNTVQDAVTGDAAFSRSGPATGNGGRFASGDYHYWDVDQYQPGGSVQRADDYQAEIYERPVDSVFGMVKDSNGNDRFGLGASNDGSKYYEYLDIVSASTFLGDQFFYVQIDLFGEYEEDNSGSKTKQGLMDRYGFRIGTGADEETAPNGGYLIQAEDPGDKVGTSWGLNDNTAVYKDINSDAANSGITVTRQDLGIESAGDGYEEKVADKGVGVGKGGVDDGAEVLFTRLVEDLTPENEYLTGETSDWSIIEFALDYQAIGFSKQDLLSENLFLLIESHHTQGNSNYFWNDEWDHNGAGTPNWDLRGVDGFQDNGLAGNIYKLDTLLYSGDSTVPEPATIVVWSLLGICGFGFAVRRKLKVEAS